jgi:DNA repair exonuclease SbcCD ATPase subunit
MAHPIDIQSELSEDTIISTQKYACISFLPPNDTCTRGGVKLRGSYATLEEAQKRAQYLQKVDPGFDIYISEVGKWLPCHPNPNDIEDQEYADRELNQLMKEYKKTMENSKEHHEQRKFEMLKSAKQQLKQSDSDDRINKRREKLRKKLENRKKTDDGGDNDDVNKQLDELYKKYQDEQNTTDNKSKLENNIDTINSTINAEKQELKDNEDKLKQIHDNLAKIKKEYRT